ncbi:MAG: hypothetical protein IJW63_03870 [Lachnospiraceae bacterium]|nr:hypothetical protein [Lachnospiraceae bacterium]
MGSDEEYLDNLLKSVSTDSGERKAMTEEEIAALFSTAEASKTEESTDVSIDQVFSDIEMDADVDDIMALDDSGLDFDAETSLEMDSASDLDTPFAIDSDITSDLDTPFAIDSDIAFAMDNEDTPTEEGGEDDYDFVLDELNEAQEETAKETPVETESEFLAQEEVEALLETDADLFDMPEDQSDLVDLESLDIDVELGTEILEEVSLAVEEVPDTEEIEQGDMLDIASMFSADEDLAEGATYDTSGFYEEESSDDEFNPFADMSDIDDLLKAVNWSENKSEEETVQESADETNSELTEGVYLEDMDQITSEDLEALLPKDEDSAEELDALVEDFDLSSLGESEDADMAELGNLLQMADGEESFDLFGGLGEDTPSGNEILHMDEEDPKEAKKRKKAEKAEAKARKKSEKAAKKALKEVEDMGEPKYKKVKEEPQDKKKEKKEGFFAKVMTALLEEEEEEAPKKQSTEEVIEIDDNQDLLETLDKEDKDKKKKEKKEKPKKEKAPKPKKEKKEKQKKETVVEFEPSAKIRKNSIIIVVGFAASLLVFVLLGNAIVEPIISKHNAKKAFEEQQYEECYQLFAGQNLSEDEQMMLDHASVVLKFQRRIWRYEEYSGLRDRLNALDTLFETVANYDEWYQEALNCGARSEVEAIYADIMSILDTYGVSEAQAQMIANLNDVEYTRVVTALSEGESLDEYFGSEGDSGELPDLLPGEMN